MIVEETWILPPICYKGDDSAMELHRFKAILLDFLSDITNIPERSKRWFLDVEGAKNLFDAPNGYKVLSPYVLVKLETSSRVPDLPKAEPEETEEVMGEEPKVNEAAKEEIYHCVAKFKIFTESYTYYISATWQYCHAQYLGCIATTRKVRAGESHLRGNDLPDGYFCRETWEAIKNAIIRDEMKALSKYIEHGRWQEAKADGS